MDISGFFMVTVKIEADPESDIKKGKEVYLVKCATAKDAAKRVEEEMDGLMASWKIDTVKEMKINAILDVE